MHAFEARSGTTSTVLMLVTAIVVGYIAVTLDAAEALWSITQRFEAWELDELFMAIAIAGLVFFISRLPTTYWKSKRYKDPTAPQSITEDVVGLQLALSQLDKTEDKAERQEIIDLMHFMVDRIEFAMKENSSE